jgi:hypothetical protein
LPNTESDQSNERRRQAQRLQHELS